MLAAFDTRPKRAARAFFTRIVEEALISSDASRVRVRVRVRVRGLNLL